MFQPVGKRNLLVSILLIAFFPISVWFGYTMLASGFYSPMYSFLNDPTKIISNPGGPIIYFVAILVGLVVLFVSNNKNKSKDKYNKKFATLFTIISILVIIVGGYSIYQDFSAPIKSSSSSIVKYKTTVWGGGKSSFHTYRMSIETNGETRDFNVSNQIYNIFNIGDKVSVTYKLNGLETITLRR